MQRALFSLSVISTELKTTTNAVTLIGSGGIGAITQVCCDFYTRINGREQIQLTDLMKKPRGIFQSSEMGTVISIPEFHAVMGISDIWKSLC